MWHIIFIFLTIIILFLLFNMYFKKNIENYGVYCGTYNLNPSTAQRNCSNDIECIWNNYTTANGKSAGWCGQHPGSS